MTRHTLLRGAAIAGLLALAAGPAPAATVAPYIAGVEAVPAATGATADRARGAVFLDLSRDGARQQGEPGLPGVIVSNGRDAVATDAEGRYELPVFDNMTVMVTKPAGYATPSNADGVPQFFRHHLPEGTPEPLRYGGLAATGALPAEINFPLVRQPEGDRFSCVAMGDTQPYSGAELGFMRDSMLATVLNRDLSDARCMLLLGDVMGDDLGLLPRHMTMMSAARLPLWYVHGNHDFDFDASTDEHSADSWRQIYGPNYYAFEIGKVFFVALDNVVYPCTAADARDDDRRDCAAPDKKVYNGRVDERQMTWLRNVLALVPEDRLIVLMHHIPFVSFTDSETGRHQTDNANAIYALLEGRKALSLSGHTHTFEYLAAGEAYEGWRTHVDVGPLPFDHIVGGAPSGNWYFGDLGFDGTPLSFARCGTPPGFMMLEFEGTDYRMTFHASNQPAGRQMGVAFSTPDFRRWHAELYAWLEANEPPTEATPPVSVGDLEDMRLFTPADLSEGVFLTANVWAGDRHTRVTARIGDGPALAMERTQAGNGEGVLAGAEWADPFSVPRQMTVGRYAWRSGSPEPRAQGFELWTGERFGPSAALPGQAWMIAQQSPHLWRVRLPDALPEGAHVATVTAVDRHGRQWVERVPFEVMAERPPRFWRAELWAAN